jgi:enoyl-CoA hydratase
MSPGLSQPVRKDRDGPIVTLTIQNPPLNILTTQVLLALADAVVDVTKDPTVRCMIIAGSGDKAFSAGADIKEMMNMTVEEAARHSAKGQALTNLIEHSPIPAIAAVRGYCLGEGCEISLACDFIMASEDAVFGQPEINLGVIPGWGGSRRLTRAIGVARARRWIFTGEIVPAEKAYEEGLVDKVVPKEKLMDESLALARVIASKGAVAMAAAKYAVNEASDATRLLGLEYERDLWEVLFQTEDQKEGMKAFFQKRPPLFVNRPDWEKRTEGLPWRQQRRIFLSAKRKSEEIRTGDFKDTGSTSTKKETRSGKKTNP